MTVIPCFQSAPPIPPTGNNLQALLDATPNGQTLNIGSQQFVNPQPVIVNGGKSIVGTAAASVGIVPSTLRNWQTLIIRGAGSTLSGFQVVGNAPNNHSYVVTLEAQHAIEIQGADDIHLTNLYIHNTYGDAVAFQKDSGGNISNRARIINCFADEIGRCQFTPIAVNDLTVRNFRSGTPTLPNKTARINQSLVDIEPPGGGGWNCQNFLWTDCDYRIGANTFVLSRLGQGANGDIANVVVDNVRMLGGNFFAVSIGPPDAAHGGPVRDGAYCFQTCVGSANYAGAHAPFRAWRNDGLEIHDYQQTSSGPDGIVDRNDSTGPGGGPPLIDSVVVHQRADSTGEWYAYDDGTYWTWSD